MQFLSYTHSLESDATKEDMCYRFRPGLFAIAWLAESVTLAAEVGSSGPFNELQFVLQLWTPC